MLILEYRGTMACRQQLNSLVVRPTERQVSLPSVLRELFDILVLLDGVKQCTNHSVWVSPSHEFNGSGGDAEARQDCSSERAPDDGSGSWSSSDVCMTRVMLSMQVVSETKVVEQIDVRHVSERVAVLKGRAVMG